MIGKAVSIHSAAARAFHPILVEIVACILAITAIRSHIVVDKPCIGIVLWGACTMPVGLRYDAFACKHRCSVFVQQPHFYFKFWPAQHQSAIKTIRSEVVSRHSDFGILACLLLDDLFLTISHTPRFHVFFRSVCLLGLHSLQGPVMGDTGLTCRLADSRLSPHPPSFSHTRLISPLSSIIPGQGITTRITP